MNKRITKTKPFLSLFVLLILLLSGMAAVYGQAEPTAGPKTEVVTEPPPPPPKEEKKKDILVLRLEIFPRTTCEVCK